MDALFEDRDEECFSNVLAILRVRYALTNHSVNEDHVSPASSTLPWTGRADRGAIGQGGHHGQACTVVFTHGAR
jgi:hypothetical protein